MMALFTGCRVASLYREAPAPTASHQPLPRVASPYREAPTHADCSCGQPYHNECRAPSKHLQSKYITVRGASLIILIGISAMYFSEREGKTLNLSRKRRSRRDFTLGFMQNIHKEKKYIVKFVDCNYYCGCSIIVLPKKER